MLLHNKPFLGIVAFIGISSIIGSGFCLWIFNEEGSNSAITVDGVTVDCSFEANVGHFAGHVNNENYEDVPLLMVFTEGNASQDLNEGIEFYKVVKFENNSTVNQYVKDDAVQLEFHKDLSFKEDTYGLVFELGAQIDLITDASVPGIEQLTKYVTINNELYKDGNFVNLTNYFTVQKDQIDPSTGSSIDIYTFEMHISDLFGYTSLEVKPTNATNYTRLYKAYTTAFSDPSKQGWKIKITFTARYVEKE